MIWITLSPNQKRQMGHGCRHRLRIAEHCHHVLLNSSLELPSGGQQARIDQIVMQDFELEDILQTVPRATKDAVEELPPQLAEGGFRPLANLTEQEFLGLDVGPGE